jgi:hypothetical protein
MQDFNTLTAAFEKHIPSLFETGKGRETIGRYIRLIRENRLLSKQYLLFERLKEGVTPQLMESRELKEEYVNALLDDFGKQSRSEIEKANAILEGFITESAGIREFSATPDTLTESATYLVTEGKKDIETYILKKHSLIENLHPRKKKEDTGSVKKATPEEIAQMSESFLEKYSKSMTEEEKLTAGELLGNKTWKEKLENLVKRRADCLENINTVLSGCKDPDVKERLLTLKEQILSGPADESVSRQDINALIVRLHEINEVVSAIPLE